MAAEQPAKGTKDVPAGAAARARLAGLCGALREDISATLADIDAADVKDRASLRRVLHAQRLALADTEAQLERLPGGEASKVDDLAARRALRRSGAQVQKRPSRGNARGGAGGD